METEPVIRSAEDSDREQVLNLLNSVFSEQQRSDYKRDEAYWNWKFKNSVFGPSILTVADHAGKIVGVDHLWPWEFCLNGKFLKAVQPCDTVVDPHYRRGGLFKKMRRYGLSEAEESGYQFVFNFPNENSLPGNRSLGATYLGKITWWVRVLKPIHLVFDKFFSLEKSKFLLPEKYRIDVGYLDRLAEKYAAKESFLQIHRITGFHQWRYMNHPSRRYGMIKVNKGHKQTAIIFTIVQKRASLEMVIVDFIGDKGQKMEIVHSMVKAAKRLEADFIAVMNNRPCGIEGLWKYKFIKKKLKNMVVLPLSSEEKQEICSFDNWSMVAGLHDSI